ncbi:hypothetical protein STANM309S_04948 [Streptomyces tanashiensis]
MVFARDGRAGPGPPRRVQHGLDGRPLRARRQEGGWYRNIAFVPSYNDADMPAQELSKATKEELAPYGIWWGDWAQTSDQWIEQGGSTGGDAAPPTTSPSSM